MQVLTPSGYKDPVTLADGDDVCAFDQVTGAPIINKIENIDFVDAPTFLKWNRRFAINGDIVRYAIEGVNVTELSQDAPVLKEVQDLVVGDQVLRPADGGLVLDFAVTSIEEIDPARRFTWYRINGTHLLFGEQSIWRNGAYVCHARDLVVDDVIYDDQDRAVTIASIEALDDTSLIWYRFDISGDHSYIVDGLTVHNASSFWVGGTGTLDSSSTTHWANASGGTPGTGAVPGSADTATLDGSSGGGTVTMNFGGTWALQTLTMGSFTGTFDNSANNNNITCSSATGFAVSGSGIKTFKLGSATYTVSNNAGQWNMNNAGNTTFQPGTSTIMFTGSSGDRQFNGGDKGYATVSIGASSGAGTMTINNTGSFSGFPITPPNWVRFAGTPTFSNAVNWAGTSTNQIFVASTADNNSVTMNFAASSVMSWVGFRSITATGSPVASSSFNLGNTSGITITAPSGGGGGKGFSGSFVG